jgi:uncharacterized SAM-dependent methyltransferase
VADILSELEKIQREILAEEKRQFYVQLAFRTMMQDALYRARVAGIQASAVADALNAAYDDPPGAQVTNPITAQKAGRLMAKAERSVQADLDAEAWLLLREADEDG